MKPQVMILADSADVTAIVMPRLISLVLTDNSGGEADTLTLTIDNADELVQPPAKGRGLEVFLGYDGIVANMGTFVVDEVSAEGPPSVVTIEARSAPFDDAGRFGTMSTKMSRSWDNLPLSEVVATIAGEAMLAPVVSTDLAAVLLDHIDQTDESNAHFLTRLAKDYGAIFKATAGRIVFVTESAASSASGTPLLPVVITRAQASRYSYNQCQRELLSTVVAKFRDTTAGLDKVATAGTGQDPKEILRYPYSNMDTAVAAAKARMAEAYRKSGSLSLVLVGDSAIRAETPVTTVGFPLGIDGKWTVKKATHNVTPGGGYVTTVECEPWTPLMATVPVNVSVEGLG